MTQTVEQALTNVLGHLDKTMRGTLLGLANRTIEATPVQTGRLRSNWQVSTGGYPDGELEVTSESVPKAAAASTVSRMDIGDTFYFSNNLDYAEEQEEKKGMLTNALNALLVEIG
jgi:hypothetical protein